MGKKATLPRITKFEYFFGHRVEQIHLHHAQRGHRQKCELRQERPRVNQAIRTQLQVVDRFFDFVLNELLFHLSSEKLLFDEEEVHVAVAVSVVNFPGSHCWHRGRPARPVGPEPSASRRPAPTQFPTMSSDGPVTTVIQLFAALADPAVNVSHLLVLLDQF